MNREDLIKFLKDRGLDPDSEKFIQNLIMSIPQKDLDNLEALLGNGMKQNEPTAFD